MKTIAWASSFGLLIGLLAGGVVYLVSRPERGKPVELMPPPTAPPLVVHVSGAVNQPGVYALPAGSRVQDAIQAAGGFSSDAFQESLNLAALIEDGEQVSVPLLNESHEASGSEGRSDPIQLPTSVNINTATQQELEALPRIGPAIAEEIIAYREKNGPFTKVEDIQNVPGIGPAIFEEIKDQITIAGAP